MADYLKPHTPEWFIQFEKLDSPQAQATKRLIAFAGKNEVCSFCGDEETQDFVVEGKPLTLRLCEGCKDTREALYGESYILVED